MTPPTNKPTVNSRLYHIVLSDDNGNPFAYDDCWMPEDMLTSLQALGWRVVEIEGERDDDD